MPVCQRKTTSTETGNATVASVSSARDPKRSRFESGKHASASAMATPPTTVSAGGSAPGNRPVSMNICCVISIVVTQKTATSEAGSQIERHAWRVMATTSDQRWSGGILPGRYWRPDRGQEIAGRNQGGRKTQGERQRRAEEQRSTKAGRHQGPFQRGGRAVHPQPGGRDEDGHIGGMVEGGGETRTDPPEWRRPPRCPWPAPV